MRARGGQIERKSKGMIDDLLAKEQYGKRLRISKFIKRVSIISNVYSGFYKSTVFSPYSLNG